MKRQAKCNELCKRLNTLGVCTITSFELFLMIKNSFQVGLINFETLSQSEYLVRQKIDNGQETQQLLYSK
uniref:Uncharacterized protein n=1 Tax=Pararge aegeria TaxID=116150 RepID=S4P6F6_9NEOP